MLELLSIGSHTVHIHILETEMIETNLQIGPVSQYILETR